MSSGSDRNFSSSFYYLIYSVVQNISLSKQNQVENVHYNFCLCIGVLGTHCSPDVYVKHMQFKLNGKCVFVEDHF